MSLPQSLGSYVVERELGRGGMGVVYLARDPRLNRSVAIKVIPEALALNPDNLARFEREAKLLAAVNHPNIAAIYGVEEVGGQRLLILEFVPGDTLSERIGRGALPVGEALDVARQIAAAIEAAHEGGIIHRDLKPGNVKVTPDGLVKVLDFGLAKGGTASSTDLAQSPTLTYSPTAVGVILGTAGYMSPEQARGKPVDRRADIWAFACVLFECLTGRKTFEGETVSDTIARIIEREPDYESLPPSTPPAVRELLRRCLEKDVRKRQRDIGDVRIELESIVAARASASSVVTPATAAPASRSIRSRWVLPALCAIGGAVAATALWLLFGAVRPAASPDTLSFAINVPPSIQLGQVLPASSGHDLIISGSVKRPDGTVESKARLYVRKFGAFDFTEIPGTEGVTLFTQSPNAPWLAIVKPVSEQSADRRLSRVAIDGSSPPVTIAEWDRDWTALKWLRDDDLLILTARSTKFFRLPSGGGQPKPTLAFDFAGVTGFPQFGSELPDGRGVFLRFETWAAQGYRQDILVLDPNTGKTTKILENGGNPQYDPVSKHVFFSSSTTLLAVPFDLGTLKVGKDPVSLFEGLRANSWTNGDFEFSTDGTLVFDPGGKLGLDRRIVTVDAGRQLPFIPEMRPYESSLSASRDGKQVAVVVSNTRGTYETWTATFGQPGLKRTLAQLNADCTEATWSPDGQWLAFNRNGRKADDGIYIQRGDGGGQPTLVLQARALDETTNVTDWLPGNAGVLITRSVGEKYEPLLVRIQPDGTASAAESMRDSPNFTGGVKISPDGKLALFIAEDSGRPELYVAEFANGKIDRHVMLVATTGQVNETRWGSDSKRYYVRQDGDKVMTGTIERTPTLHATPPTLAYDLTALHLVPDIFDIMPNGQLLGIQLGQGEGERTSAGIVLNWLESARRKLKK